ncbi:hypothetical protein [Vagococcus fluvialis]|uniref:hypothetical protein n=1 Tax=Vagococcus fluvialis TaxID=2738 RepID=UPI001D09D2DA|nr:hypothetical protein [Vagococcus fluvialis]UDM72635.1 hypothetical protein K5L00_14705 [Vagococcus fluvialis]UDM78358.1 hypothetical protein K5K98_14910 [Vagococcus fluvialis]UDM83910.1 hypothetical protein K5K96_14730 [Vagococcus fluvialis]
MVKKYVIRNDEGSYYVTGLGHWVFSSEISQAMPYYLESEARQREKTLRKYLDKDMLPLEILPVNVKIELT